MARRRDRGIAELRVRATVVSRVVILVARVSGRPRPWGGCWHMTTSILCLSFLPHPSSLVLFVSLRLNAWAFGSRQIGYEIQSSLYGSGAWFPVCAMAGIALTAEQFQDLLKVIHSYGAAGGEGGGHGRKDEDRARLKVKDYERVDKYDGGEERRTEWAGDFMVATAAAIPKLARALEVVVAICKKDPTGTMTIDVDGLQLAEEGKDVAFDGMEKMSAELYQVLTMMTNGEAKTIVKRDDSKDGIKAWTSLVSRFDKRSMGRAFRELRECMYPTSCKDLRELTASIGLWEDKWKRMVRNSGGGGQVPEVWRMAAMLEICPQDVKETMLMKLDEVKGYQTLKEKILTWVTNRVEQGVGPVLVDVGAVAGNVDER